MASPYPVSSTYSDLCVGITSYNLKIITSWKSPYLQCMPQSLNQSLVRPYALDSRVWAGITRKLIATCKVKICSEIVSFVRTQYITWYSDYISYTIWWWYRVFPLEDHLYLHSDYILHTIWWWLCEHYIGKSLKEAYFWSFWDHECL